jgi:hypothetical protein
MNYLVYVAPDSLPLIYRLDSHADEATPIGLADAPIRVVQYARSLEAWANSRPMPLDALPAEFFAGMREVCATGVTVAVNEDESSHLH